MPSRGSLRSFGRSLKVGGIPPLPAITPIPALASLFAKPKHKYSAVATEVDGINFKSKGEAALYQHLKLLELAGEVSYFLREVPVALPGSTTYRVDFLVFYVDGRVRYLDLKGVETQVFKIKKRQVEALYPIIVEVIRRERGRFIGL